MTLRLVFMGTPDFALPVLKALIDAGHEIAAVYSQPPRPAGRGMAERPTPVHAFAAARGIPVRTPVKLSAGEVQDRFAALAADAAVVVAYGLLLPKPVLAAPRLGCFNVHASLLPRWRGAAPIQRAIMAGDAESGVSIMRMAEGLDTGPVCLMERVTILPETTAGDLHDRLAVLGAGAMVAALNALEREALACSPQPEQGVTYAAKILKSESRIDFARSAPEVQHHIHGLSPFPGAWTECQGQRIRILRCVLADGVGQPGEVLDDALTITCGSGALRLLTVQREGKGQMDARAFLRGFPIAPGAILGG